VDLVKGCASSTIKATPLTLSECDISAAPKDKLK